MNYDEIELQVKEERTVAASIKAQHQHHSNASALTSSSSPSLASPTAAAAGAAVPSAVTNSSTWQSVQPARIQSMVVQNDGTIILCDNDPDIVRTRPPRIEVVEIVSPPNYIRGKFPFIQNRSGFCCRFICNESITECFAIFHDPFFSLLLCLSLGSLHSFGSFLIF